MSIVLLRLISVGVILFNLLPRLLAATWNVNEFLSRRRIGAYRIV